MTATSFRRALVAVGLLLMITGCARVQPWERGNLARPQMAPDPHPLQSALRAHNYSSREAVTVGGAAQGGGCGCY